MRKERFAVIVALTALFVSGCATGRSPALPVYVDGPPSASSTANQYHADPPGGTVSNEEPLQPVPVPPVMGVSHVKPMGYFTAISFGRYLGYKSVCTKEPSCDLPVHDDCGSETCASEACVEKTGCGCSKKHSSCGSLNIFGRFWPKKSSCTVDSACGSVDPPCSQSSGCCASESVCVPHVNCVPQYGEPLRDADCCNETGCCPEGCDSKRACLLSSFRFPKIKMPACKLPSMKMPHCRLPDLKFPTVKVPALRCGWKSCWAKSCGEQGSCDGCVGDGCGSQCGDESVRRVEQCRPSHGLSPLAEPMQDPFADEGSEVDGQKPALEEPSSLQAVPEVPEKTSALPALQAPVAPTLPVVPSLAVPEKSEVRAPQAIPDLPAVQPANDVVIPQPVVPAPATELPGQTYVEPTIWPRLQGVSVPVVRGSGKVNAWSTSWRAR